jgi:hypothetical protein
VVNDGSLCQLLVLFSFGDLSSITLPLCSAEIHIFKAIESIIQMHFHDPVPGNKVGGIIGISSSGSIKSGVPGMGAFDMKAEFLSVIHEIDLVRNLMHILVSSSPQKRL